MLGYPIVVIPCGHHVQELIPKHVTRLLSGKVTTGPRETLFFKFYAKQNMVADLIRPDTELKKFDQDAICWNTCGSSGSANKGMVLERVVRENILKG